MEPLCRETQGLRFFSLFKNIPPFLPFSLEMPLYRGIETREGHFVSLPWVKRPVHKGLKSVTGVREGYLQIMAGYSPIRQGYCKIRAGYCSIRVPYSIRDFFLSD